MFLHIKKHVAKKAITHTHEELNVDCLGFAPTSRIFSFVSAPANASEAALRQQVNIIY